jgi:hypothetical protein
MQIARAARCRHTVYINEIYCISTLFDHDSYKVLQVCT